MAKDDEATRVLRPARPEMPNHVARALLTVREWLRENGYVMRIFHGREK